MSQGPRHIKINTSMKFDSSLDLSTSHREPNFSRREPGFSEKTKTNEGGYTHEKHERLRRSREVEPRDVVYVYNYGENKMQRMKTHELEKLGNVDQVEIPYSVGSIPIRTNSDELGGGYAVVARVHVNLALRLQRWLGMQKRIYVVDEKRL